MQIDAARKHPRNEARAIDLAIRDATSDQETAQGCFYAVPRAGKTVEGPSIRLAEFIAKRWSNVHSARRVIEVGADYVTAEGAAWDLETNNRQIFQVRRRITDKHGRRFSEDMIMQTGNAAAGIAWRNAVLSVVGKEAVERISREARRVAIGNASTLAQDRDRAMTFWLKAGVPPERVLARLGRASVADITAEDVQLLRGLVVAVREEEQTIDEAFPLAHRDEPSRADDVECDPVTGEVIEQQA